MRAISFAFLVLTLVCPLLAGEPSQNTIYPFWDGVEPVANYAKRVELTLTKTLDLGNNVKLELVLVPAGKFIMGTPEPTPVDEELFNKKILTGQVLLALSGGLLLVLFGAVIIRAIRKRERPRFSLAWFLAMTVMAGIALLSGLHWQQSKQALRTQRSNYEAARARYKAAFDIEKQVRSETIFRPVYMGRYVVTQEQYQVVMGNNPSFFTGKDTPVNMVSWDTALLFCDKLTEITRKTVRLPTEAEWEFSCRAGTVTTYYSGDAEADLDSVAWYSGNHSSLMRRPHPVGQKVPNAFGLYDMHGNVEQWCDEEFIQGNAIGSERPLRGGSFNKDSTHCHAAYRVWLPPGTRRLDVGFRIVMPVY